jgi:hypothetical protein
MWPPMAEQGQQAHGHRAPFFQITRDEFPI